MPAPDLKTCYNYQTPFEKAFAYLFGAACVTIYTPANAAFVDDAWREANPDLAEYIFSNEDEFQNIRPNVQLRLLTGNATGHRTTNTDPSRTDAYVGQLQVVLITKFSVIEHREYLATVRGIMGGNIDYSLVPYHYMSKCVESGLSEEIKTDEGLMITAINYETHISIKADAWPEGTVLFVPLDSKLSLAREPMSYRWFREGGSRIRAW